MSWWRMARLRYRIVNVFCLAGDPFSGNPLCVFEQANGLSDAQMQGLARQLNLSETTFILPSTPSAPSPADARVRIFTPSYEMPFAGHPTLGTAHVIAALSGRRDAVSLELAVGVIKVRRQAAAAAGTWTLEAVPARSRPAEATRDELAQMLGIAPQEIAAPALWVNAGTEQLLVPVTSEDALARCGPRLEGLLRYARVNEERSLVYVFTPPSRERVSARLFFNKGSSVVEDPATGSACANLGGYLLATGHKGPLTREIHQGRSVHRPSRLGLHVDAESRIFVTGEVLELGSGVIDLPD